MLVDSERRFVPTKACLISVLIIIFVAYLLLSASSCANHSSKGSILLCSSSVEGAIGDYWSQYPSISGDGRFVAFESQATNLVPGDDNGWLDILRKDLETGDIVLCSVSAGGEQGDGDSEYPSISEDGRYVVFQSRASNLVPGDDNDSSDVFRKDLETGEVVRCSISSNGSEGDDDARSPCISADGRYVSFHSYAINFLAEGIPKDERRGNVFLKDLETGELQCCSTTSSGELGDGNSEYPNISFDGKYVAFESSSSNLVPGTDLMDLHIYRKDMQTGEIVLCSTSASGELSNGTCHFPSISSDDRYVVFESNADNLTPDAKGGDKYDVYRKDLVSGEIVCCSVSSKGELGDSDSGAAAINLDGRYVAFLSRAHNLVPGGSRKNQVFRKDLESGDIVLCSSSSKGKTGYGDCSSLCISWNGRYIAFGSYSSNLIPGDDNENYDVYRKDCSSGDQQKVEEVLSKCTEAMAAANSVHIQAKNYMKYPNHDNLELSEEGDAYVISPDKVHRVYHIKNPIPRDIVEVWEQGDNEYILYGNSDVSEEKNEYPCKGLEGETRPFPYLENPKMLPNEKVDGLDCYVIQAGIMAIEPENERQVTFYIDKEDFLIRKVIDEEFISPARTGSVEGAYELWEAIYIEYGGDFEFAPPIPTKKQ